MYLMSCVTTRAEKAHLIHEIHHAPDKPTALEIVRGKIEPQFETLTAPEHREAFCQSILEYLATGEAPPTHLTGADFYGAFASFLEVFLSCLPAALPFVI